MHRTSLAKQVAAGLMVLVVLAACRAERGTVAGTYDLLRYDGEAVPWNYSPLLDICRDGPHNEEDCPDPEPTGCWMVLSSGGSTLFPSGEFEVRWEYTSSCTGEVLQDARVTGTYASDADSGVIFEPTGSAPMTGRIRGDLLEVRYGETKLVFRWDGAEGTSPTAPPEG